MITPRFNVSQSENSVTITIRAPYCNLRDLDASVDENVFLFYSSPYYLRLQLPGSIEENDYSKSSFDADSGEFTFSFEKTTPGEHFPDLDLVTKLICSKLEVSDETNEGRKIEVLSSDDKPRSDKELNEEFGFAFVGKKSFGHISSEFQDIFEIDPREVPLVERHKMRVQHEQGKFNEDHYLSDFIENDEIMEIISYKTPWSDLQKDQIEFSNSELDFLKDLPNVNYNLSELQINYCHCCLVDILYAYCYDQRTTQFEGNIESGWTIVKLAASLCWLDAFKDPKETLVSSFRRSLIHPLYRSFELSQTVLNDLKGLLKLGEKYIIKCLIQIYNIFLKGDCCRYILNNLFIKDYVVYVMKWDKEKWREIVSKVDEVKIDKKDLGLNLIEIEESVCSKINFSSLTVNVTNDDSDDTDSSTETSSSSDDSSDTIE